MRDDGDADMVDVRRAATLVGRHPETVRRWVWSGRLPARRRGNRLLIDRRDVEAIAASHGAVAAGLAEWAGLAREQRSRQRSAAAGGSAAALVLEDRAQR